MKSKIIFSDNSVLADNSRDLNDYQAGTTALSWVATQDALFVGSPYPFTSKYIKVSTANPSGSARLSISYWDGTAWRSMSDFTDHTVSSGRTLARSGYLEFATDKRYTWTACDTVDSNDQEKVTGLGDVTVYDMYWIKITATEDLSATLSWCGDIFCQDADLGALSPHLLNATFMTDWKAAKTDWEEQRVVATDLIIQALKNLHLEDANLLLNKSELCLATVYQTMAVIYGAMGDGYTEQAAESADTATKLLKTKNITKDNNLDGRRNPTEGGIRTVRLVR